MSSRSSFANCPVVARVNGEAFVLEEAKGLSDLTVVDVQLDVTHELGDSRLDHQTQGERHDGYSDKHENLLCSVNPEALCFFLLLSLLLPKTDSLCVTERIPLEDASGGSSQTTRGSSRDMAAE